MTLLVFAPVAYLLVSDGKLLLAGLCWFGIQAVEPLPDRDFHLPGLTHRGVSHSLLGVIVIGGGLGGAGWLLGGYGFDLLYSLFSTFVGVWDWLLGALPELSASVLAGLVPNIPPGEIVATLQQQAGGSVDRSSFAMFGGFIGAYGVLAHLLGDVITVRGIKPFLPVSHWRLSLSSLRADSPTANSALFGLGMVAIALVVVATVPGAIVGGVPADLSPVDVAAGQDNGSVVAENRSVQINETSTNRTQVVLESVSLPQNGYIVAQTGNATANESGAMVVGHTQYVRNGTFEDVVLRLNESINGTETVSVALYNDTNGNETLDVGSNGTDAPYRTTNGTPIHDRVTIGGNRTQNTSSSRNATVTLSNQTTNGSTVRVKSATLPDGGFLVLHGSGFSTAGVLDSSAIAVSPHLEPGSHTNITLRVRESPPGGTLNRTTLNNSGTYGVIAYQDTNNNQRFEFLTSDTDGPYIVGNSSNRTVAADTGRVIIRGSRADPNAPESPSATVAVPNQRATESSVTVRSVRLPDGGFVVVHTASYQSDPLSSTIGVSRYLPPGTYQNVSVQLTEPIQKNQTLIAVPSRDTNDTQTYDYVSSDGFHDVGYTTNGEIMTDRASVSVVRGGTATAVSSSTTTEAFTSTSATTPEPTTGPTVTGQPSTGSSSESESGGVAAWVSSNTLLVGVIVVVVLAVIPTLLKRL